MERNSKETVRDLNKGAKEVERCFDWWVAGTVPVNPSGHFNFPFLHSTSNSGPGHSFPIFIPLPIPPSAGHRGRMDHVGHLFAAQVHVCAHGLNAQLRVGHVGDDLRAQPDDIQLGSL